MHFRVSERPRDEYLAPRLGELTLFEGAECAVALRLLAQHLLTEPGWRHGASRCGRAVTWLEEQLRARASGVLTLPDDGARGVLLDPIPGGADGIGLSLRDLADDLHMKRPAFAFLGEHCLIVAVAADDPAHPSDALLSLGRRALERHDVAYAIECFDQLQHAPDRNVRIHALDALVDAYLEVGERDPSHQRAPWRNAASSLYALLHENPEDLRECLGVTPRDIAADLESARTGGARQRPHVVADPHAALS